MAELSIEQKRLAVEKGLAQFLPDTVLQRVLQYWESEYGHQPSFVLNRFLSEICTSDDLRLQRKEMLRQVLHEISVVEKQERLKVKRINQLWPLRQVPKHWTCFRCSMTL